MNKFNIWLFSIIILSIIIPTNISADNHVTDLTTEDGFKYNYDNSKSQFQNALDLCGSSSWLTTLFQSTPSKQECDKMMMALYSFCQGSVAVVDSLAEGFNRQIQPGSPASLAKEQCSDERLLNYDYPDEFKDIINKDNLNQKLMNLK